MIVFISHLFILYSCARILYEVTRNGVIIIEKTIGDILFNLKLTNALPIISAMKFGSIKKIQKPENWRPQKILIA